MPVAVSFTKGHGRNTVRATLLDAVTALTDGEWINVSGYQPGVVQVKGITTANVEVDGSCQPSRPSNTEHGFTLETFTAPGAVRILDPVEWIKVRVVSYTSGTISGYYLGYAGAEGVA